MEEILASKFLLERKNRGKYSFDFRNKYTKVKRRLEPRHPQALRAD